MFDPIWSKIIEAYEQVARQHDRSIRVEAGDKAASVFYHKESDTIIIHIMEKEMPATVMNVAENGGDSNS